MNKTARQNSLRVGRRTALKQIAALGALASVPAWMISEAADAAEKCNGQTPKPALKYQDKPKGNERCDNCTHFCAGPKPSAMGTCAIVKGSIDPQGWCLAWAAQQG